MRGKLATAACGLMLIAALGIPAAAQAAVTRQGPADATTTATAPDTSPVCATNGIYDVGNGHYAGHDGSNGYIAFTADLPEAIPYCYVDQGFGNFWIEEETNGHLSGQCLTSALDSVFEGSCSQYTLWEGYTVGTYHSQTEWLLQDQSTGLCLYDNTQHPAIEDTCKNSDGFERFVFDALP